MSQLLRFLSQRLGSAKSRLRRNIRVRFSRRFDAAPDREWSHHASERHAFHEHIRESIRKYRAARAMRNEFYEMRDASRGWS
jgi:hypothetical protein